ncbi:MAG: glycosyltransferase family 4 protein [Armatimonadetes bacterium]|nr:glycosyltransferase family 4 protein [Armatimonadota bacterium]
MSAQKKVSYVCLSSNPVTAGGERYVNEFLAVIEEEGYSVHTCPLRETLPAWRRALVLPAGAWFSRQWIHSDFEFIFLPSHIHPWAFLARSAAGERKIPRLVFVPHMEHHHLRGLLQAVDRLAERIFYSKADFVLTISESTAREVEEFGVPASRIRIVPPGTDLPDESLRAPLRSEGILRLITVGRCSPIKGYSHLLSAMALLSDLPVSLFIIGNMQSNRRHFRSLQDQTSRLGLERRVHFLGAVEREEMWRRYRESDLAVSASLWEGYGIFIAEALAFGLPVVAADGGAVSELVSHGSNGLLVPPGDPKALASAIRQLWGDRCLREEMGARAKNSSPERPWSRVKGELRDMLREFSA